MKMFKLVEYIKTKKPIKKLSSNFLLNNRRKYKRIFLNKLYLFSYYCEIIYFNILDN